MGASKSDSFTIVTKIFPMVQSTLIDEDKDGSKKFKRLERMFDQRIELAKEENKITLS